MSIEYATRCGENHYGSFSDDVEYQERCVSCQHLVENPSDIFGSCYTCVKKYNTGEHMYDSDEPCWGWLKCVEEYEYLTEKSYKELFSQC